MDDIQSSSQVVTCPRCGVRAVPILFGLPTFEAFEAADRGEIVLGGCLVVEGDETAFACTGYDCGLQFA